jgi:hypothetical protein
MKEKGRHSRKSGNPGNFKKEQVIGKYGLAEKPWDDPDQGLTLPEPAADQRAGHRWHHRGGFC